MIPRNFDKLSSLDEKKVFVIALNLPALQAALRFEKQAKKKLSEYNMTIVIVWSEGRRLLLEKDFLSSKKNLQVEYYYSLDEFLQKHWRNDQSIFLFFAATGIIIRKIAPLLTSKYTDPPVIAADFSLQYFIPLLSGHSGQAVEIAKIFSQAIPKSVCVLTGASDQLDFLAIDLLVQKWRISMENSSQYPALSNAIVEKTKVYLYTTPELQKFFKENIQQEQINCFYKNLDDIKTADKKISFCFVWQNSFQSKLVTLRITNIFLGIGCNRGTDLETIEKSFFQFLQENFMDLQQIKGVASAELKKDEGGLLAFCKKYNLPVSFFSKEKINILEDNFSKSAAQIFLGIKGVAEPCAVLVSINKTLIIKKQSYAQVTIAAAF